MSRLPNPGGDNNVWGSVLNDYLLVTHNTNGTLRDSIVGDGQVSSLSQAKITGLTSALTAKADDTAVVHKGDLVLNVKDYGAKGDWSVDDTAAIQAAITAAASSGASVYIPKGNYPISSALSVPAKTTIRGDGPDVSIIIQQSTSANGITINDANYVTLENFRLQGPASGTGVGIAMTRTSAPAVLWQRFKSLYIREFGSHGLSGSNVAVSTFENITCESNSGHGFYLFGVAMGTAGTSTHLNACYANNNGLAGYVLFKMVYCVLSGCAADSSGIGYLIDTCQSCSLLSCGSEYMESKNGSYPGIGFKITASQGIGLYNTWTNHNMNFSWWVTGSSVGISILGAHENEPDATAVNLIKVDTGSGVTLADYGSTDGPYAPRPNSLASGTTTILNDGSQGISIAGTASFTQGLRVGADAFPRFNVTSGGGMDWGPGSSGVDTNLYRGGAGTLVTDGNVVVGSNLRHNGSNLGFYGTNPAAKPTVTGSRGGNAALASLITALAQLGLVTDSTTS